MALNGRASTAPATIDGHGPRRPRNLMSAPSTTATPSTSRSAVDDHAPGQPRPRDRRALGGSRTATATPLLDSRAPRSTRPPTAAAGRQGRRPGHWTRGRTRRRPPPQCLLVHPRGLRGTSSSANEEILFSDEASVVPHRPPTRRQYLLVQGGDQFSALPWLSRVVIICFVIINEHIVITL